MDRRLKPRILFVEDDVALRVSVAALLRREGLDVLEVPDGLSALRQAARSGPALVILDLMLPDIDGLGVCEEIRSSRPEVPILILSARSRPGDRVQGLEMGADDYLIKPFEPAELVARVKALLRRVDRTDGPTRVRFGPVEIDLRAREVRRAGEAVRLSPTEFAVLETLAITPGKAIHRAVILDRVWGPDAPDNIRVVDYYVFQLRKKLERSLKRPRFLKTVPGIGYRLDGAVDASEDVSGR